MASSKIKVGDLWYDPETNGLGVVDEILDKDTARVEIALGTLFVWLMDGWPKDLVYVGTLD